MTVTHPHEHLSIRPTTPADLPALRELIGRCSPETLYRRFHGAGTRVADRELQRIAAPTEHHRSWVALDSRGTVRGTATLACSRSGDVEVAVLVEDAWFRHGVGQALTDAVASAAQRARIAAVHATVQADNRRAREFLHAVAPGAASRIHAGEIDVTISRWAPRSTSFTDPTPTLECA